MGFSAVMAFLTASSWRMRDDFSMASTGKGSEDPDKGGVPKVHEGLKGNRVLHFCQDRIPLLKNQVHPHCGRSLYH